MNDTFTVNIEIYESRVHVLHNIEDDDFKVYCKIHFDNIPDRTDGGNSGTCWTILDKADKEHYVLDFRKRLRKDSESINLISHEVNHAVNSILDKVDIHYNVDNDEPYCYLMGHLMEKVFKGLFETNKKGE